MKLLINKYIIMRYITFLFISFLFLFSCDKNTSKERIESETIIDSDKDRVDILYFFGKQRCISCNEIEGFTHELIKDSFANEIASGKLNLRIIDCNIKENQKIAEKYEIVGSGLVISKWEDGKEEIYDMTAFSFNHLTTGEKEFKTEISKKIKSLL